MSALLSTTELRAPFIVLRAGLEPAWPQWPRDFKSRVSNQFHHRSVKEPGFTGLVSHGKARVADLAYALGYSPIQLNDHRSVLQGEASWYFFGGPCEIQTRDLCNANAAL